VIVRARCLGHNQSWNLTKEDEERRRRRCGELLFMIITHRNVVQLIIHYPYAVDMALSSTCVTCDEKTFFFFFFSYKQNPHVQYILMASTRCTSTNKNLANQQPDLCAAAVAAIDKGATETAITHRRISVASLAIIQRSPCDY
jgi:hypothetical protein